MALEDQVAKYEVQITRSGSGASEAVSEFQNLDKAATATTTSLRTSSESLTQLREVSLLTRESVHGLNEATMLAGMSGFPELQRGAMAARMGLLSLRTATMLTGESLGVVATGLGVVAAIVATAVVGWKAYEAELQAVAAQQALVTEQTALYDDVWKKMQQYRSKGIMSDDQASAIAGAGDAAAQARAMNSLGFSGGSVDALQKFQKLKRTMDDDSLAQYDKERAKASDLYYERLGQIQKLMEASKLISPEAASAANKAAGAEYSNSLGNIGRQENAAKSAEAIKQLESDITLWGLQESNKREGAANEEFYLRVDGYKKLVNQGLISEGQYTEIVIQSEKKRQEGIAAEVRSAQEARDQETSGMIKDFNQQEQLYGLTSKQDKKTILDQELADRLDFDASMMLDYRVTLEQMGEMDAQARIKYQQGLNALDHQEQIHVMTLQQMENQAARDFASGFSTAFVSFINGTKSAGEAFAAFAQQFLSQVAEMIMQQEILNALRDIGIGVGGAAAGAGSAAGEAGPVFQNVPSGTYMALGGIRMAASGLAGVSSVSSPTYFPKFNVMAGEAGNEALTVLARPRFMDIGGIQAMVGKAGNNTMAITNASDLANKSGPNGTIVVELRAAPGYEASIVQTAIQGAVVKVTSDMGQNTALRQAAKQAVS